MKIKRETYSMDISIDVDGDLEIEIHVPSEGKFYTRLFLAEDFEEIVAFWQKSRPLPPPPK